MKRPRRAWFQQRSRCARWQLQIEYPLVATSASAVLVALPAATVVGAESPGHRPGTWP